MAVPNGFDSTRWSLVLAASAESGEALDLLCRTYWRPVYIFIRGSGLPPTDAEDATQEFFADMLRREWLKLAAPERGSFRAFLLTRLRHFLANRWRHERALKRGGSDQIISMSTDECERELAALAGTEIDPATLYERNWAGAVLDSALQRLTVEQLKAGKSRRLELARPFLTQPPSAGDYERLAVELELSRGQVAVVIHRLSRRYAELIRAEVAATTAELGTLEDELRHLLRIVSR